MKIDVVTIFPAMVDGGLTEGVTGRARVDGVLDLAVHDLRQFTRDRHRTVDDVPYGGGPGMVMKPEPWFEAMEHVIATRGRPDAVLMMTPQGRRFTHAEAVRFSACAHLAFLCGRYEGVDERVTEAWVTDEVSIGDYVLTGGELPALVVIDAVARLIPGVVGDADSVAGDSFVAGRLDHPHYTRPAEFRGLRVPEVLISGHHAAIDTWRREEALRRTFARRPDLLAAQDLSDAERAFVRRLDKGRETEAAAETKERRDEGD